MNTQFLGDNYMSLVTLNRTHLYLLTDACLPGSLSV